MDYPLLVVVGSTQNSFFEKGRLVAGALIFLLAGCFRLGVDTDEYDGGEALDVDEFHDRDGADGAHDIADGDHLVDVDDDQTVIVRPPVVCDWTVPGWTLTEPVPVNELNSNEDEHQPRLSVDGLTIFFASARNGTDSDLYFATRPNRASPFGVVQLIPGLNTEADETAAAIATDGLSAIIATTGRPDGRAHDIWMYERARLGDPFESGRLLEAVSTDLDDWDPFLSFDGLDLYGASIREVGGSCLWISRRIDTDGEFPAPEIIEELCSTGREANPSLTFDDRVIVFNSGPPGRDPQGLYYAVRPDRDAQFVDVQQVPVVNSPVDEGEPAISGDGCELYFTRHIIGSELDIFRSNYVAP